MRTLHHFPLSAPSRMVRLVLTEKKLDAEMVVERFWERRLEFLALNHAGEVPVLVEAGGQTLAEAGAICEYLDEVWPEPKLLGATAAERAEVRRLTAWFGTKFAREVTEPMTSEKLMKRMLGDGHPDSQAIRGACLRIHDHLEYIGWLTERRTWLAGATISLADIAAAAHLSVVDFLGAVPWSDHQAAHDWYARMKSRPSFRPLLGDTVAGIPAAKHYADLDF